MTDKAGEICLACGGTKVEPLLSIPDVPALCNRLCASAAEATSAPRGTISLSYCCDCGHVANFGFDSARVRYDSRFENTLSFSPRYRSYAEATAERLVRRYRLCGKRIVEIGCGNGDFLRLLCAAGNDGAGYDPSQPNGRYASGRGNFTIVGRNFTAVDAQGADLVCCRHVLEHLPEPGALLRRLRASAAADSIVFFEVPNALFILDRLSIWDIIYEHVSYFTPFSLAQAFHSAGFGIRTIATGFDDQYLWIEAAADDRAVAGTVPPPPAEALYGSFGARFAERVAGWRRRIEEAQRRGRRVVVWGAGAKGVMFTNLLRIPAGRGIDWLVDVNPRKHGHFVPLTGQQIVGPDCLRRAPPDLVVIMNPEYEAEIRSMIAALGIDVEAAVA
ncbi:MAG TPA: class I SAM-dependent methyltransferase [Stellaceae bacterium]|nr:class I SAM-dependent methyltransferase [Stellaceae bacterium]